MIKYKRCYEIREVAKGIALDSDLKINFNNIAFVVSHGAKSNAYARIYGLSKAIQIGHVLPPLYTIEFLCNKIKSLNEREITGVLIHEFLHIPYNMSGGLRPHGNIVNSKNVKILLNRVSEDKMAKFYSLIKKCCSES
ncbi:metallopeptidase [Fervidicoccus fontis]|uniref:Metallopeptidase-like protein n=2 Tax=Fervidicoccus fontis TaxID=683846 RepID=H9ZZT5_FERFK|nr:putative metallopeptidase [Fervidicoccus fontis]AFH42242.1 metallopeptidase-like protein [Fervidicoccus fontis Kam940]MBE9390993.1 metallopeptidase [Fervidicoccus fontis]PMB75358.1 MAG: zinc metalloprotease HtpX [Fervidicoccus fontis]PMB75502.1 MAG: zinc metalloprotease HtpX [Fervidicoccus fontis]PMB76250.1 MAG: zinc metalloprotease HtpX [Fervidicoccus fontis]